MGSTSIIRRSTVLSTAVLLAAAAASSLDAQRYTLPAGTVVLVHTTTPLQSASMKTGETFETTVDESVGVDEYTVIPAGSRIRGVATAVTPATRQQSGVIEVSFDQLILADGSIVPMLGRLTSTDTTERRQIKNNPNQRVVLVGGRGGIGAAIAGASRNQGTFLSQLGALLSEGADVSVPAGTQFAVELERAITLRGRGRIVAYSGGTIYTAADRVRSAQTALSRLNYYRGPINGTLDDATRRALFEFQVDRGLSNTGNLDRATAQALGLNLTEGLSGAVLTADQATILRRDAQAILARHRAEIGASAVGQLSTGRGYTQSDLELLFALSAFADNSSLYEQIIRNGGNQDAAVLAGKSLVSATRRVDTAMQGSRASATLQNAWATVRQRLTSVGITE